MLSYDMMHFVPQQSAPDWIKSSPLSTGDMNGYVEVDKHTMQHVRYPNVFALGDAGSTPNSKTGAAIRKQAPVVVDNIDAFFKGRSLDGDTTATPHVRSSRRRMHAAGGVRLRHGARAVVPGVRSDQAAPGVLVPQEVRPAVPVLEPDAQGLGLSQRLQMGVAGSDGRHRAAEALRPDDPGSRAMTVLAPAAITSAARIIAMVNPPRAATGIATRHLRAINDWHRSA